MRKSERGFTLIELVMVVTILGLLAGFALPKFAALQADARLAKIQAALGAARAAAAMARVQLLARGIDANFTGTPTPNIVIEGTVVTFVNGYPDAASLVTISGIADDYVTTGLTAPRMAAPDAHHTGSSTATDCTFSYIPPTGANTPPTFTLNATVANCA